MSHRPRVVPGQVWKERDRRFERYIVVGAVEGERAHISRCLEDGGLVPGPVTTAHLDRFEHDYELVRDA